MDCHEDTAFTALITGTPRYNLAWRWKPLDRRLLWSSGLSWPATCSARPTALVSFASTRKSLSRLPDCEP